MKLQRIFLILAAAVMLVLFPKDVSADTDAEEYVQMYRVYNPNSGEHFYTANEAERLYLVSVGWRDEGIGWIAPVTSSKPVFRLYNENAGDHHYTMSKGERNALVKLGWKDEGIGWYSDPEETVPLYRQYNPNAKAGSHNYTTNKTENDYLVSAGWQEEGIGWYALDIGSSIFYDTAYASIEATVTLNGGGKGYNAKILMSGKDTGIASLNVQHEETLNAYLGGGYPDDSRFYLENVMANLTQPGTEGKNYIGLGPCERNKPYKIRLSWHEADNELGAEWRAYVNGQLVSTVATNIRPPFIFGVEAGGAFDGDSVDAVFTNVRVKVGNSVENYGTYGGWAVTEQYFGYHSTITNIGMIDNTESPMSTNGSNAANAAMHIYGTADIPGINPADGKPWNWDTCFGAHDYTTEENNVEGDGASNHCMSAKVIIAERSYYGY